MLLYKKLLLMTFGTTLVQLQSVEITPFLWSWLVGWFVGWLVDRILVAQHKD